MPELPGEGEVDNLKGRKITSVPARENESFAVREDGLVWYRGNNISGRLADEHVEFSREPRQIVFPPLPAPAANAEHPAKPQ